MIFLLLPFLFNPFGFALRWLPALYLAAWPVIIQTLGREALITHALILIIFILVCDITRATMLRLIGLDLISLPVGIGLIALLFTDKGFALLHLITPVINALLLVSEPALLIIETIIVMDFIRTTNKWISKLANIREDNSRDLSSWEPPLTRTSLVFRFVVVLITVASYLGTYLIIQESKTLLNFDDKDLPIQFNHAIALLVTLQTISFFATIYKDEGVLSETAMVALAASVPIFIAAWSFNNLKQTEAKSSHWSCYFPFSLFACWSEGAPTAQEATYLLAKDDRQTLGLDSRGRIVFGDFDLAPGAQLADAARPLTLDFGAFEAAANLLAPGDSLVKQLLLGLVRRSFMVINSLLGLSLNKLAKYYFGPDFWYILAGRVACLVWWAASRARQAERRRTGAASLSRRGRLINGAAAGPGRDDHDSGPGGASTWLFAGLTRRWPSRYLGRASSLKVLFVLAYAQMLIQRADQRLDLDASRPVLARLLQSISVHLCYLFALLFFGDTHDGAEEDPDDADDDYQEAQ